MIHFNNLYLFKGFKIFLNKTINIMTKFIFVTGGVISGLGKGVISASLGSILQMLGESNLTVKKLDPYLNIWWIQEQ